MHKSVKQLQRPLQKDGLYHSNKRPIGHIAYLSNNIHKNLVYGVIYERSNQCSKVYPV